MGAIEATSTEVHYIGKLRLSCRRGTSIFDYILLFLSSYTHVCQCKLIAVTSAKIKKILVHDRETINEKFYQ
jgi:hypothetical protein